MPNLHIHVRVYTHLYAFVCQVFLFSVAALNDSHSSLPTRFVHMHMHMHITTAATIMSPAMGMRMPYASDVHVAYMYV